MRAFPLWIQYFGKQSVSCLPLDDSVSLASCLLHFFSDCWPRFRKMNGFPTLTSWRSASTVSCVNMSTPEPKRTIVAMYYSMSDLWSASACMRFITFARSRSGWVHDTELLHSRQHWLKSWLYGAALNDVQPIDNLILGAAARGAAGGWFSAQRKHHQTTNPQLTPTRTTNVQ